MTREQLENSAIMTVGVLLVLGLVTTWSVLIPGVTVWDDVVVSVIGSLRLTGPVAAGYAAWVAVRKHRAWRGGRPSTWLAMKTPLAIIAVVVGSFGATVLLLTLRAVLGEQAGRLLPSGLAVGAAGLTLYVVLGWLAGWLVPYAFVPPVAAVAAYGLFTWLAEGSGWADRLAPATREPYDLFQGLSPAALTDQTLWLTGISTALLLGWAAIVTRQPLTLAAALLAVFAAGAGVLRLVDEPPARFEAQRVVYSCQEWPITVCVHPGMRGGLTELGSAFTGIAGRLSGTPAAFDRVEQRSRATGGRVGLGVVPIHVDDLATGYAQRAAAEFVGHLAGPCPEPVSAGYREIVLTWLRGEPLPGGPLREHRDASAWFSGMTEEQRRDWLRMYWSDFAGCRLGTGHFGTWLPKPSPTPLAPAMSAYPSVM